MTQTVLILGASGKVGSHCAEAFWNAGWTVRRYDRSTDMTDAAQGADVIINGLNPPNYHDWPTIIPQITRQVIAAAKASGATVIMPGTVYPHGNQPGEINERTPQVPCTRKGQIRAEMERAFRASGIRIVMLRAGHFIAPDQPDDFMALAALRTIHKGNLTHLGPADTLQAYCYLPDWAQAAVALANKRQELEQFADIPFPGHSFTMKMLQQAVEQATGRRTKLTAFPWWIMTALTPFWELAREMREMRYLYAMPHTIGADKFARILPDFQPTDLAQAMLCGLPRDIYPDKMMRPGGQTIAAQ